MLDTSKSLTHRGCSLSRTTPDGDVRKYHNWSNKEGWNRFTIGDKMMVYDNCADCGVFVARWLLKTEPDGYTPVYWFAETLEEIKTFANVSIVIER